MKYNISFTLGDPWCDGHGQTTDYHITTTHSVEEIQNAYRESSERIGFNLVGQVGVEYDCDPYISKEITDKLLSFGVIDDSFIQDEEGDEYWPKGCYILEDAQDQFVDLYFSIAKLSLPDLSWEYRDLKEETLNDLDGAGYGFYH